MHNGNVFEFMETLSRVSRVDAISVIDQCVRCAGVVVPPPTRLSSSPKAWNRLDLLDSAMYGPTRGVPSGVGD